MNSQRCLYITPQFPLSPDSAGGAGAIFYEQLVTLAALGQEIDLWHISLPAHQSALQPFFEPDSNHWQIIQSLCRSVTLSVAPAQPTVGLRLKNKLAAYGKGEWVSWPYLTSFFEPLLKAKIAKLQPNYIWAQHFWAAQLASWQRVVPVIYSHHDWLFRVKALRTSRPENPTVRQTEEKVARRVAAVVSGSAVECAELRQLGCRQVHYLPIAYEPVSLELAIVPNDPRLVHLGGFATTANQMGLARFAAVVWPGLQLPAGQIHLVGDMSFAPAGLTPFLNQVVVHGFVPELKQVLRPYDLHIIAYEHPTGQRTRLPVAFNFAQVVVAVRAGIAGYPEAQDGVNCRLVNRIEEMAGVIQELMADPDQRLRLGRAARETFEKSFTRPGLLPRYQQLLKTINPI